MTMIYDLDSEGGAKIFGDGGEDVAGVVQFKGNATSTPVLVLSKGVNACVTVAPFRILGSSVASAARIGFGGGFISLTSILLTSAAHFDYAVPVEVDGNVRYIPLIKGSGLVGGAAF